MNRTIAKLLKYVFIITMILAMAAPTPVFAQDAEPTVEPAATEVVTEVPTQEATEAPTQEPTEVVTEEPTEVLTEAPTEVQTEIPLIEETVIPTETPTELVETVADVVEVFAEEEIVLLDEEGNPIPMGSEEAVETIAAADPWFVMADTDPLNTTGFKVVAYQADCTGWTNPNPAYPGKCNESLTPVQAAVDAAPEGSVVNLAAGTFREQVEIKKNLTLQGSGSGVTIIESPDLLVDSFTTSSSTRTYINKPVIYVHDASNVIIDGITVDGRNKGNGNYRFSGISYYNAGGTISNNYIHDFTNPSDIGSQDGWGISAYNTTTGPQTLNILNNTITDFQKGGIVLSGDNLTGNVDGNTVTGQGPIAFGGVAQNGIQVGYGAEGSVTNNTISDIYYTPLGTTAVGVLLYQSGDVVVSGNTISDSKAGVRADYSSSARIENNQLTNDDFAIYGNDTPLTVNGNTIEGGEYAIESDYAPMTATGNTIKNSHWGIYGYESQMTASGNTIDNSWYGINSDIDSGVPTNSLITNNTVTNSYDGYWGDDPSVILKDNKFIGNSYAAWNEAAKPIMAKYNYWGCDLVGCNPFYDGLLSQYLYNPWLIDPDGDGVYDSSDGTGGYVDNCPFVYNPDQADVDGDGMGNVCDSISYTSQMDTDVDGTKDNVDNCLTTSNADQKDLDKDGIGDACDSTPKGSLAKLVIPVTGGSEFVNFNCDAVTILKLPTSDYVIASSDFCEKSGELLPVTEEEVKLIGDLPAGTTYGFGMNLTVLDGLTPIKKVEDPGRLTFSYRITDDLKDKTLSVLFWDETLKEGLGDWVELPAYEEDEDGVPVIKSLHPEEETEDRMILEGVRVTELNNVEFVTNFPGIFILVIK